MTVKKATELTRCCILAKRLTAESIVFVFALWGVDPILTGTIGQRLEQLAIPQHPVGLCRSRGETKLNRRLKPQKLIP